MLLAAYIYDTLTCRLCSGPCTCTRRRPPPSHSIYLRDLLRRHARSHIGQLKTGSCLESIYVHSHDKPHKGMIHDEVLYNVYGDRQ